MQKCKAYLTKNAKSTILYLQSNLCKYIGGAAHEHAHTERRISQEELARAVGTTRQTITSIEVGKYVASLPLAYKIAHYFGLTIEEVFDFSEVE